MNSNVSKWWTSIKRHIFRKNYTGDEAHECIGHNPDNMDLVEINGHFVWRPKRRK